MARIKRIAIKGESGYTSFEDAYKDILVIRTNSVRYTRKPNVETESNPSVKWSFSTDSDEFEKLFEDLAALVDALIRSEDNVLRCPDIGATEFTVTYDDKRRESRAFEAPAENLGGCIEAARKIIPPWEGMPDVLQ